MEAKKSNQLRKEEEETKTAVNDQKNFAPRLKELVSEDRRFKPKHQTMSDEPITAIHQEVQLHQRSEAEPWNHHLRKKRCVLICKNIQKFAHRLKPSDNGGEEVEPIERRGGRNKNCCKRSKKLRSQIEGASQRKKAIQTKTSDDER